MVMTGHAPPSSPSSLHSPTKRVRLTSPDLPTNNFATKLLSASNVAALATSYATSTPYNHAVVDQLFDPTFLSKARKEIVEQISFREKETDIYKVSTGSSRFPTSDDDGDDTRMQQ